MDLLQELQDSGILNAISSLVKTKEKVAKIAVGQLDSNLLQYGK